MTNGWIKIHRKLLEWEWYDEINTFRLFIHLLLKANHKPKSYRGVMIESGQVMTGLSLLSEQTGLTMQKVRTALNNLKSTNEITIKTSNKGTIIQIVKYIDYQVVTNETTNKQQTDNKQITTNKKYKELKEDKKSVFDSWLNYRKSIKKEIKNKNTINALLDKFIEYDIDKIKSTINSSIENNYQGLFWDKYKTTNNKGFVPEFPYPKTDDEFFKYAVTVFKDKEQYWKHKEALRIQFVSWTVGGWKDYKGNQIINWKTAVCDKINFLIK